MFDDDDLDEQECTGNGGFPAVGYVWMRFGQGPWKRQMLRQCGECGTLEMQEVFWFLPDYLWCYSCMSQSVELLTVQPDGLIRWCCNDCGRLSADTHLDELLV